MRTKTGREWRAVTLSLVMVLSMVVAPLGVAGVAGAASSATSGVAAGPSTQAVSTSTGTHSGAGAQSPAVSTTGAPTTQAVTDPTAENFDACYVVSNRQNQETLQRVDQDTGQITDIGATGVGEDITDMAFQPGTATLYAVQNSVQLGTIDLQTGAFTPIGGVGFGTADGSLGAINIDSVDALTFDPTTGELYAVHERAQSRDLLLKIDPATGTVVENGFGTGVDYVILQRVGGGLDDVDGIAIDPDDGQMYGIGNDPSASDNLIAIDKATGATSDVGELGVNNIEGLTFDLGGDAYAVTTSAGGSPDGDSFYSVDTGTGAATKLYDLTGSKYLAVACGLGGPGQAAADLSVNKTVNRTAVP